MTNWPFRSRNIQHTGFSSDRLGLPLEVVWKYWIGDYIIPSPIVIEGIVYEGFLGLKAIDLTDGKELWKNTEVSTLLGYTAPAYHEGRLIINGIKGFYIVQASTGKILKNLPYKAINASPVCIENMVIFECLDRKCVAVDIDTGKEIWTQPLEWMHYTPSISDDLIFVPDEHSIHTLNWRTGKRVWEKSFEKGKVLDTTPVYNNQVVVSVDRNGVVSLDAQTGEEQWKFSPKYGPFTAPSIGEDTNTVYVAGDKLFALDLNSGQEIWSYPRSGFITSVPIVIGGHLLIGGGYNYSIYLFDRKNGELLWTYPTKDLVLSTAAYSESHVLIGSHDGFLYCFKSTSG